MKIVTVVGARPNFIKAAVVSEALSKHNQSVSRDRDRISEVLVHTGQHYDDNLSQIFFDQLIIPRPHYNLEVGSGPHGRQIGQMLEGLEQILQKERPDLVLVYGDADSTLAGGLAASVAHIPLAHVEAGLRSNDRRMHEEVNRIVVDHLSSHLFCPTASAVENLRAEGLTHPACHVHRVGDVMYDAVLRYFKEAEDSSDVLARFSLEPRGYFLSTIHRRENREAEQRLRSILTALAELDGNVLLPIHPGTRAVASHLSPLPSSVILVEPVSYFDMLVLEKNARVILTDSGGIQKEAFFLKVPCVTLREETEWHETVDSGCNILAGADKEKILDAVREAGKGAQWTEGLFGNGNAAEKTVRVLADAQPG